MPQLRLIDVRPWAMDEEHLYRARRGIAMCRAQLKRTTPEEGDMLTERRKVRPVPPRPKPVAKVLRDTAKDLRDGTEPVVVALRLENLAERLDPRITA